MTIDDLDARIVEVFAAEPRVGVLECSRRLGVARGTVQARLDRMTRDVIGAKYWKFEAVLSTAILCSRGSMPNAR